MPRTKKTGGMTVINENATPMTNYDLAHGYSTLQNGGKKTRKSRTKKTGGMTVINENATPMTNYDLAHGYSTLQNGGKKTRKSRTKKGGADPNMSGSVGFYNTSSLPETASPYALATMPDSASLAPTPFSSGMPNHASVEYGLPQDMSTNITAGLDNVNHVGGAKKSRKSRKSKSHKKTGGDIMKEVNDIWARLNASDDEKELKEKEKTKGGKKSKKGGGDTLANLLNIQTQNGGVAGAFDWQTQLALDDAGRMAGGKKKRSAKK